MAANIFKNCKGSVEILDRGKLELHPSDLERLLLVECQQTSNQTMNLGVWQRVAQSNGGAHPAVESRGRQLIGLELDIDLESMLHGGLALADFLGQVQVVLEGQASVWR